MKLFLITLFVFALAFVGLGLSMMLGRRKMQCSCMNSRRILAIQAKKDREARYGPASEGSLPVVMPEGDFECQCEGGGTCEIHPGGTKM